MPTIAIVDDDPITRESLRSYFEDEGFDILSAPDAERFQTLHRRQRIDLVFLDIRLPGKDGLTLTRELRAASEMGIILITGRDDHMERLIGLELGADDHIAKPFEPRELLARARALLRRIAPPPSSAQSSADIPANARFEGWEVMFDKRRLVDPSGETVRLTTAEFDLLSALVINAGRVMSREELLELMARGDDTPFDRAVDRTVRRLRLILEPDPATPRLIATVHGVGYVFQGALE